MRLYIFFISLFLVVRIFAQEKKATNYLFGVNFQRSGVIVTDDKYILTDYPQRFEPKLGYGANFEIEKPINGNFAYRLGLAYNFQSFSKVNKNLYTRYDSIGNIIYKTTPYIKNTFHYIDIPLELLCYFGKSKNIYTGLSWNINILMSQKNTEKVVKDDGTEKYNGVIYKNTTPELANYTVGFLVGYKLNLSKKVDLCIQPNFQFKIREKTLDPYLSQGRFYSYGIIAYLKLK